MARPKAFQEEEVLDRAVDLFWQRGFHSTSIAQLVEHLGINRASLYDTFGGKEALFHKAFTKYREKNIALVRSLLQGSDSVKQAFEVLFHTALDEVPLNQEEAPRGCMMVNSAAELLPEDDWMQKILAQNRKEVETLFADSIQVGQEKGEINQDLDPTATGSFLFTLYSGIKIMTKVNRKPDTMKAAIDTALLVLDPA